MRTLIVIALMGMVLSVSGCTQESENEDKLYSISEQLKTLTIEVVRLQEQVAALSVPQKKSIPVAIDMQLSFSKSRLGNAGAEYAIVEYMDYQCPYCIRHAQTTFLQLKRKYIDTGLIQYIVKDFPLDFHAQAESAAVAARCSANQGKFEVMHDLLINNSKTLSANIYIELARQAALDTSEFERCFSDRSVFSELKTDILEANRLGISGTPRFLIGKVDGDSLVDIVSISGAQSIESFDQALQSVFNR